MYNIVYSVYLSYMCDAVCNMLREAFSVIHVIQVDQLHLRFFKLSGLWNILTTKFDIENTKIPIYWIHNYSFIDSL